jgi:hypothetical protein
MGFMADKMTMMCCFSQSFLRFPLLNIIPPLHHAHLSRPPEGAR